MGLQDLVIAKKVGEFEKELKDIKTILQMNNQLLNEIIEKDQ